MLLQFPKNPITDYQQVTDFEILPDFQNNFQSLDFIARKSRWQKSKCKENYSFYDKMILFVLVQRKYKNILFGYLILLDSI